MLEDATGRVMLEAPTADAHLGQRSDVLGSAVRTDAGPVLREVHFRRLGEIEADRLPILATAEQICQLTREEAAQGYPVRIRGIITSVMDYDADFEGVIVQDATRGVLVNTAGNTIPLEVGDYCEIEGKTSPYGFQPDVQYTRLKRLGTGMLPNPVQPMFNQLINGAMHCNYVELEGVITSFLENNTITLLTRGGRINVRLNSEGAAVPEKMLGATIRLRGTLVADWNEASRKVLVGSIYLDQQKVTVIHPVPANPFSLPLKSMDDLLQFDPQAGALHRVKVSGQLIYGDEQMSFLINGENGIRFIPTAKITYEPGDWLEVVGFLDLSGLSPLLQDAVVRKQKSGERPPPRQLEEGALLHDELDSRLVQVEGMLLGASERTEGLVLDMQTGMRRYIATVRAKASTWSSAAKTCSIQPGGN